MHVIHEHRPPIDPFHFVCFLYLSLPLPLLSAISFRLSAPTTHNRKSNHSEICDIIRVCFASTHLYSSTFYYYQIEGDPTVILTTFSLSLPLVCLSKNPYSDLCFLYRPPIPSAHAQYRSANRLSCMIPPSLQHSRRYVHFLHLRYIANTHRHTWPLTKLIRQPKRETNQNDDDADKFRRKINAIFSFLQWLAMVVHYYNVCRTSLVRVHFYSRVQCACTNGCSLPVSNFLATEGVSVRR